MPGPKIGAPPSSVSRTERAKDRAYIVLGGDHPYAQWRSNGQAKAYSDRGLRAYLAINTDEPSITPGDANMLTWAQLAEITQAGHEIVAHGARHIQNWSRINTGIKIGYTGANATATVQVSATQLIATAGGGDSVTVTLAGQTLAGLAAAINAVTGWTCSLAPELTGTEAASNLLQIAATSVKNLTVRFAAGGGITVVHSGTTYRHAFVQAAFGNLKLYGDGRRLLNQSLSGGATLSTLVTAINAISGFTAKLMDNDRDVNATAETYVSGSELAASIVTLNPGLPCIGYPAVLNAGLPRWYMVDRQLQRCADQAAANGYPLDNFASSGGAFTRQLIGGHRQYRNFRGNPLSTVDTGLPDNDAVPAYATAAFRPVKPFNATVAPASSGRLTAMVAALADSPGFLVDSLVHNIQDDASSSYSFPAGGASSFDQVEVDFVAYLDALKAQIDAGTIVNLLPSEVPATVAESPRPRNYIFNPRFRNSGEALAGIAALNRDIAPGWGLLTPGSAQSAVSVDANGAVNITTATTADSRPLMQVLHLEPGKTYELGLLVEVLNYTSGSGISLLMSVLRGWQRNDAYGVPRSSRSRYATALAEHLRMQFTVPAPEEFQRARIISPTFGAGIDMSVNKNIKLAFWGKTLDNLDISAGAASATAVTSVEAATAINNALTAAAKAGTIGGEFQGLARSENGSLVIEVPVRGPDPTYNLTVTAATANSITATAFGTSDTFAVADFASAQDALLLPLKLEIAHALAVGTQFRVSRPYCQEIAVA